MKKLKQNQKGFSLIEMIVVLFIVSLLMLLIIPGVMHQRDQATIAGNQALESVLQSQVDLYKMEFKSDPISFDALQTKGYLTAKQKTEAEKSFTLTGSTVTSKTVNE